VLPNYLLPENVARTDGSGPVVELGAESGKLLVVTLAINRILEQESLDVAIFGSADGVSWSNNPLARFPQKFYCGVYSVLLNLASNRDIRWLRVQWRMNRWPKGGSPPLFGFYVYAEESGARLSAAVA
jgi:hypothetical protein